jgi:hypothetical protein
MMKWLFLKRAIFFSKRHIRLRTISKGLNSSMNSCYCQFSFRTFGFDFSYILHLSWTYVASLLCPSRLRRGRGEIAPVERGGECRKKLSSEKKRSAPRRLQRGAITPSSGPTTRACTPARLHRHHVLLPRAPPIDGVYSYQTLYGFASGQIPRHSQGTLLPLSVRTQGIESVEQCATQGFNLVK